MLPFLVFAIAALGLNILTGYAGQLSLGTGGFMACGAFAAYKLATAFPDLHIVLVFALAGLITAGVGILFGLPSLRIKGFYLAVATLAAQFFLVWLFNKLPWFTNYSPSGRDQRAAARGVRRRLRHRRGGHAGGQVPVRADRGRACWRSPPRT